MYTYITSTSSQAVESTSDPRRMFSRDVCASSCWGRQRNDNMRRGDQARRHQSRPQRRLRTKRTLEQIIVSTSAVPPCKTYLPQHSHTHTHTHTNTRVHDVSTMSCQARLTKHPPKWSCVYAVPDDQQHVPRRRERSYWLVCYKKGRPRLRPGQGQLGIPP